MTPPPAATCARPSLARAFAGIWQLSWRALRAPARWLAIAAVALGLGVLTGLVVRTGSPEVFRHWAVDFYLLFLVPVVAFLSGAGLVRDDLKSTTVDYLFTRPVPRPAYIVFRYITQMSQLQVMALLGLLVMVVVAGGRGVPGVAALLPMLLLGQVLGVAVYTALGFLAAAVTARYLVVGLLYGAIVEVGIGQIPMQLSRLSILHHLRGLFAASSVEWLGSAVTLAACTVVLLALAAATFAWREFGGTQSKDL